MSHRHGMIGYSRPAIDVGEKAESRRGEHDQEGPSPREGDPS